MNASIHVKNKTDKNTLIYIYIKISRYQRYSRIINSNRTFADTNPGIKKNYIPIKIIFTLKTESGNYPNHCKSPEEGIKSETRVERKYM